MKCRRCEKELPEGETVTCPYCGIRQDTYIIPRQQERYRRPKMKRGAFLSIVSVALVIFIVAMLIPFLRDYNKRGLMSKIEAAYESGNTETLNILYAQLQSSYPKSSEEIDMTKQLLDDLLGVTPSPTPPDGGPITDEWMNTVKQKELDERLQNTKSSLFDISSVAIQKLASIEESNLVISWVNKTAKTVEEIRFSVEGYDESGNAVRLVGSELSRASLRSADPVPPGEAAVSTFLDVWETQGVTSIKLLAVGIRFDDDTTAYIQQDVLELLAS